MHTNIPTTKGIQHESFVLPFFALHFFSLILLHVVDWKDIVLFFNNWGEIYFKVFYLKLKNSVQFSWQSMQLSWMWFVYWTAAIFYWTWCCQFHRCQCEIERKVFHWSELRKTQLKMLKAEHCLLCSNYRDYSPVTLE